MAEMVPHVLNLTSRSMVEIFPRVINLMEKSSAWEVPALPKLGQIWKLRGFHVSPILAQLPLSPIRGPELEAGILPRVIHLTAKRMPHVVNLTTRTSG